MKLNVELFQASAITAAAKNALRNGGEIIYEPSFLEHSTTFDLLGKRTLFGRKRTKADNIKMWFEKSRDGGFTDIEILIYPIETTKLLNEDFFRFFSSQHYPIICYFDKKATCLEFSDKELSHNILYTEYPWKGCSGERQRYNDNTASFLCALNAIEKLALEIGNDIFVENYQKATRTLTGKIQWELPFKIDLPEKNLRIFKAAYCVENIIDGYASWLDYGYGEARAKNIADVFDKLTAEIIHQTRLAFSYSINEY